jgi:hypothetical protein
MLKHAAETNDEISKRLYVPTWCTTRSIVGNGNSKNSQVTLFWG